MFLERFCIAGEFDIALTYYGLISNLTGHFHRAFPIRDLRTPFGHQFLIRHFGQQQEREVP